MFVNILKIQNSKVQILLLEVSGVFWFEPGYSKIAVKKKKKNNQCKCLKILKNQLLWSTALRYFQYSFYYSIGIC